MIKTLCKHAYQIISKSNLILKQRPDRDRKSELLNSKKLDRKQILSKDKYVISKIIGSTSEYGNLSIISYETIVIRLNLMAVEFKYFVQNKKCSLQPMSELNFLMENKFGPNYKMNTQESYQGNQYIEIPEYNNLKFISVDMVKLNKNHNPLTKEDIGLRDKLYSTPPKAPKLRPQPFPVQINNKTPFILPESSYSFPETLHSQGQQNQFLENQFENISLSHSSLEILDPNYDTVKQQELSNFLQKPISTYLRQRYDSIDTNASLQEALDFPLSFNEEFDFNAFISNTNMCLESDQGVILNLNDPEGLNISEDQLRQKTEGKNY
ncbi:UNKNOWN [Stylonychia lemnae]|uniref:Uncharacterized protein n=1 Tax=Stylonychia lemnae TaxID=5949 RepID=A0A078AKI0_STYLE|nr:UNKNOWN [Stylonychia lemnae]|eukprot:CDW82724.1 UNKNOWN [Stylonychia lemnae]